jgi:hypothetical protein
VTRSRSLVSVAMSGAAAMIFVGCAIAPTSAGGSTLAPSQPSSETPSESSAPPVDSIDPTLALHADLTNGCPASLPIRTTSGAWDAFIENSDQTDLADELVPGLPTAVLICRYTAIFTPTEEGSYVRGAELFNQNSFGTDKAQELADLANGAPYPPVVHAGCGVFVNAADRFTAIVFAEPGRSDINLWYDDTGDNLAGRNSCNELSNGRRQVTDDLRGFLETLDTISPRSPVVCRTVDPPSPTSTYDDGSPMCWP